MKNCNTLAVVVTYNRCELLRQCLDALLKQSVPCDILVIDNASTDDTEQMMRKMNHPSVFYERLLENTGGAGGFHTGMRMAVERGYAHVWVMDDDTLPTSTALQELIDADETLCGEYGWLSSIALWTDGSECRMNRQKLKKAYYEKMQLLPQGLILAEQATFVSLFLRAETIREAGLPIREFFIWGDDIEYTRRISVRMGKPCYLAAKSVAIHAMKDNSGSNIATDSVERIARYRYAYRNENYLYRKEGPRGVLFYLARCGLHLVRIWKDGKDHRLYRSGILLKALVSGWFFRPGIEHVGGENA